MEMSLILIKQIVSMICMVAVGVVLGKARLLDGERSRTISQVTIYACSPCALFTAFQTEFTADKLSGLAVTTIASAATLTLFVVVGEGLRRRKGGISAAEHCCATFSNAANLVIPIVQGIWGTEYVIFISPYVLLQNMLTWTYGVRLMGGERKPLWKMLSHPNIIAVLLGAVFFVTNLRLPGPIHQGISAVGSCLGPMSMVVIGVLLSETSLGSLARDRRIFRTVFLRLIAFPLLAVGVAWVLCLMWPNDVCYVVLPVILLCSLGPSASNLTGLAQTLRHPEERLVSAVNALSVMLCAVTMPLHCMLLQSILPR